MTQPIYVDFPHEAPYQRITAIGRELQNMSRGGELDALAEDTRGRIAHLFIELIGLGREMEPLPPYVARLGSPTLTVIHGGRR